MKVLSEEMNDGWIVNTRWMIDRCQGRALFGFRSVRVRGCYASFSLGGSGDGAWGGGGIFTYRISCKCNIFLLDYCGLNSSKPKCNQENLDGSTRELILVNSLTYWCGNFYVTIPRTSHQKSAPLSLILCLMFTQEITRAEFSAPEILKYRDWGVLQKLRIFLFMVWLIDWWIGWLID